MCTEDLYQTYEAECLMRCINTLPKNLFSRIVLQVFPCTKHSRIRCSTGRKHVYSGIAYKQSSLNSTLQEKVQLTNIENFLESGHVLLSKTQYIAKLGMMTDFTANGNIVFKELSFNFSSEMWDLKVRGKQVNLENLGISKYFDGTIENLKDILYLVKLLKLCKGIPVNDKKSIPVYITTELIEENGTSCKSMRCSTCFGVLTWFCTGTECKNCQKSLNSLKILIKVA